MKAKTVKLVLLNKHRAFVNSIKDEKVRHLVAQNSIISGGCITSMLLGEPVNDFDYYFTNKETTLAVANYYAEEFNKTHPGKAVSVKEDEETGRIKMWISSTGVACEKGYKENEEEIDELAKAMLDEINPKPDNTQKEEYRPVFISSNAITLSDKTQLVTRFYGNTEEIHSNFDFVHCTCYWKSDTQELVLPNEALQAILAKELVYRGSKYPIASIIRTRKFIKRGWSINAGQYLKMCMQISEINLKSITTLEDQLTGVDHAYFTKLIDILKNPKMKEGDSWNQTEASFQISPDTIADIIDRIIG